jgi:ribonuclease PH
MRFGNRSVSDIRSVSLVANINKYSEGSCLVSFGDTKVLCNATVEKKVPSFMKGQGLGWITAEYGMLPRSTSTRMDREAKKGEQSGRTSEIQRLIGRSLRSVVDMRNMGGEYQIIVDCDVIQADGGTRTASITGGFVAMVLAFKSMVDKGIITKIPVKEYVAAISAGIYNNELMVDLDYKEDSGCMADVNFVIAESGKIVEIQGTAEGRPFAKEELMRLMTLSNDAIMKLIGLQMEVLKGIF